MPRPRSGSVSPGWRRPAYSAACLLSWAGSGSGALVTAGLLTLFVDLQFAWLDPPTYVRDLCLGFGMLLLCWLLREHLSHIIARVFATMLAAGLLFPGGSGEWSAKPSLASLLTSQRNRTLRSSARRPAWGSAGQGGIHQFPLSLELRR